MKYIVTYIIINTIIGGGVPSKSYDEFGREKEFNNSIPAIAYIHRDTTLKTAYFSNKNDASDFIERGRKDSAEKFIKVGNSGLIVIKGNESTVSNFKLDSIK